MVDTKEVSVDVGAALIRFVLDLGRGQAEAPVGALAELLGMLDRRWHRWAPDGPELMVRDIRRGSLIIELGLFAAAGMIAVSNLNGLFDFAKNLEESMGRIKNWRQGQALAEDDHEVARAITALTRAGITVTLSVAIPGAGSVYARVSPTSVEPLARRIDLIQGPPPAQMLDADPVRKNVRLFVIPDGEGRRAFVPQIDPHPLPFSGEPRELPYRGYDGFYGGMLSDWGQALAAAALPSQVPLDTGATPSASDSWPDSEPRMNIVQSDAELHAEHALGKGFLVNLRVRPGEFGPSEYIVLEVKHEIET